MSMQDVQVETLLNIRCIIILQQLTLLWLAIALFAKGQFLLPEFFCEGAMRTPVGPWKKLLRWNVSVKEKEKNLVLLLTLK